MKNEDLSQLDESLKESASSSDENNDIPAEWKYALNIPDEAHLPHFLPVRWQETSNKHQKIAFDPANNRTYDLESEKFVKHSGNPVQFIKLTKNQFDMPGSSTPAAARYTRYKGELDQYLVKNASGNELVPCIAHGDFVQVEALASDHLQAKEEIIRRQRALVKKINDETEFAEFLMKQPGMDKFFIKVDDIYYGSLFFYELYFNDIDNIWLICDACNLHKSNKESLSWFQNQWLYGQEFLDYLAKEKIDNTNILIKVNDKNGLAQVAIKWFWERHANYIMTLGRFFQAIKLPIEILNQRIDHVIGAGKIKRAERLQTSFDFRLSLIEGILNAKGIDMPRTKSESLHSSSDEERYIILTDEDGNKIEIPKKLYQISANEVTEKLENFISTELTSNLQAKIEKIKTETQNHDKVELPIDTENKKRMNEDYTIDEERQLKRPR